MSSSHNYLVSAQKPTAVNYTASGSFTSSDDLNLIVAKAHQLEIFLVTDEGLKQMQEIQVFGRIAVIKLFRPAGESKDLLFMLTSKYQAAILEYTADHKVITRAHGNVSDKIGRPSESGIIVTIDPTAAVIALRLYDSLLKIIEWQTDSKELRATNLRFDEPCIMDLLFLEGTEKPTLAYIYQDRDQNRRHLKTVGINFEEKEFIAGPWSQANVECEACILLPVCAPQGGCVLIGQESISYHKDDGKFVVVAPPVISQSTIVATCRIDPNGLRYLLGDFAGRMFLLLLEVDSTSQTVTELKVEYLGECTVPERIEYLDNGVVYVGSRLGDSQLIRLNTQPTNQDSSSFLEVLESFTNLGPIVDMCLVDMDNQPQLVTCSGAFKEGSLRVIRNGIGINELALIDLQGIKGIWALSYGAQAVRGKHNLLALAFVAETRFLALNGEEVEELAIPGALVSEWLVPLDGRVSVIAVNAQSAQVVVACGKLLYYLQVHGNQLTLVQEHTAHNQVACIDITPIGDSQASDVCAIGLWTDIAVQLLSLPELKLICNEALGGDVLPRSIMMCRFEQQLYLLVALGDGTLYYYAMNKQNGELHDRKKVTLGTQPVNLRRFGLSDANGGDPASSNVFACSDRPAVIYSSNQKLIFANVNLKLVTQMCQLQSDHYPNALAMSDGHTLMIGTVDEIQKLHIRTVPLGETPRRIAHQPETQTFAVLSYRTELRFADSQLQSVAVGGSDTVGGGSSASASASASAHTQTHTQTHHEWQCRPSASTIAPVTSRSQIGTGQLLRQGDALAAAAASSAGTGTGSTPQATPAGTTNTNSSNASTSAAAASISTTQQGTPVTATAPSTSYAPIDLPASECEEVEVHSVLIIDQNTFDVLHSHQLGHNEMAQSVISCKMGDDPCVYYVVGTAIVNAEDAEAKLGRLLVFQYMGDAKLTLVHERDMKGSPYSLAVLNKKLLAAVNSSVRLFEWLSERELRLECSYFNFTIALYVKTKGDFVLCGDLQRSVNLLAYKQMETSFEEIARHYRPNWTTAVEIVDDDNHLVGENSSNLYAVHKDSAATIDEERAQLQDSGMVHVGQMINVFKHGSLVMQQANADQQPALSTPVLFGTVDGGVGMVMQCEPLYYKFLHELELAVAAVVPSCGRIDHSVWRQWCTERQTLPAMGFIDGDLLELVLEMNEEQLIKLCGHGPLLMPAQGDDGMRHEATPDELLKLVEELNRMH